MNNVELLLAWCECNPIDLTARGALIDELMECRECGFGEASRIARDAVIAVNDAANLAMAAALIQRHAPTSVIARWSVLIEAGLEYVHSARIYLLPGDGRPRDCTPAVYSPQRPVPMAASVGADWLIETVRQHRLVPVARNYFNHETRNFTPTREIP